MKRRHRLIATDAATGPIGRPTTVERVVLLSLAAASAAIWAVGVTVLQPLSEPAGPGASGENNTYWARELRYGALLALILVLIVTARGDRRATRTVCLGGLLWLGADLALDRIDQISASVPLAAGAALMAMVGCLAVWTVPGLPRPATLLTVGTVAAVAAGFVTITESPTDTEAALHLGSAAVGSLLALIAVAAGVRAAGMSCGARRPTMLSAGLLVALTPALLRYLSPQPSGWRVLGAFAITALLVGIMSALAAGEGGYPVGVAVLSAVLLPVMWFPLVLASVILHLGAPFTMLAANPPVNAADEDVLLVLLAIPIGLILGRVIRAFVSLRPADDPV
ncbi:hypothetical protein FHR83_006122 [Actinoplanes campanulatus]|uniref:Uncharacterized protein n=1 Tax=Actinoplanes campanulatus TaxID=113559 RepID=A0A7W5FH84_9ACTN|nr:hypothetical protein [Actinoplanes campanulatus]MBB3098423.1 hypothetical protein [Actinoplanes campanulatus]GGN35177.1 hypothetical protein GCM10010109_58920 [Actinoplanes campanulatus]GID39116.1 hypothetical protein Aca09nite_56220 [Actinoplanes campanulatus]